MDNIISTVQIVLIVLKIVGVIDWAWKLVLTPLWFVLFLLAIGLLKTIWEEWGE